MQCMYQFCSLLRKGDQTTYTRLLFEVGCIIAVYLLLFICTLHPWSWLPEESFEQTWILGQAVVQHWYIACIVIIPGIILRKRMQWRTVPHYTAVRMFILSVSAVIAWQFSLYEYNYFFNQWHAFDRIGLILFLILSWKHPFFVVLFFWQLTLLRNQFVYPLGLSFSDKVLVFRFLLLSISYLYLHGVRRLVAISWQAYGIALLSLIGAHYVWPLIGKIELHWHEINQLSNLLIGTYNSGWLGFLEPSNIIALAQQIEKWNPVLAIGSSVMQALGFILAVNRRLCIWSLAIFAFFHVGVFAVSGILFWIWITLDIALLVLLCTKRQAVSIWFGKQSTICCCIIIAGAPWYFLPPKLAWYDTRLSAGYELQIVLKDGSVLPVHKNDLSPYDILTNQAQFYFLESQPRLAETFGSTVSLDIVSQVGSKTLYLDVPDRYNEIATEVGIKSYNQERTEIFKNFLRTYFKHVLQNPQWYPSHTLAPLHHFFTAKIQSTFTGTEQANEIQVVAWKKYFTGDEIISIQNDVILTIPLQLPSDFQS